MSELCGGCGQSLPLDPEVIVATILERQRVGRSVTLTSVSRELGRVVTTVSRKADELERNGRLRFQYDDGGRRVWPTVEVVES